MLKNNNSMFNNIDKKYTCIFMFLSVPLIQKKKMLLRNLSVYLLTKYCNQGTIGNANDDKEIVIAK